MYVKKLYNVHTTGGAGLILLFKREPEEKGAGKKNFKRSLLPCRKKVGLREKSKQLHKGKQKKKTGSNWCAAT